MKWQKPLLIILAVVFFITALTIYVNRVLLPVQAKKLIQSQAESFLKRKVEFETLHFSWVKGFIVEKLKIYQKNSPDVFLQVERLSCGVIFIPGFKQHRLTIPFINFEHPSVQLVREGPNTWNFSDLLQNTSTPEKPSPVTVSLVGINIIDGKIRIDDISGAGHWTEMFDNVNLKVALSYKGIVFDLSAVPLSQQQSLVAMKGTYQPLTQSLQADMRLHHIRPGEYFNLLSPIEGLAWKAGTIDDLQLNVARSPEAITLRGDISFKNLDATYKGQSIKADIALQGADFTYTNGPFKGKGKIFFAGSTRLSENQFINGKLALDIKEGELSPQSMLLHASLAGTSLDASFGPGQTLKGDVTLDNIKVRKDKEGTQAVGSIHSKNVDIHMGAQAVHGDFTIHPLIVQMKDEHHVDVTMDFKAENAGVSLDAQKSWTGNLFLDNTSLRLSNYALSLKTQGRMNNSLFTIQPGQTLAANPSFNADATCSLRNPAAAEYTGHISVTDAQAEGFPFAPFKNITLDADVKTDALTIKSLGLKALDTNIQISGTVINFKAPLLNIDASSEKIDLAKLKDVIPKILEQYGLEISGSSSFKAHIEGTATDLLGAKIKATAGLSDVNIKSSKFNQGASGISGNIECTPNSLTWNNFTGTYLEKNYTLNGSLNDFKNPSVKTTLEGADVQLKIDLDKNDDTVTLKEVSGKYLNISFGVTGNVALPPNRPPVLDVKTKLTFRLEDLQPLLPPEQKKIVEPLKPSGLINVNASIKGQAQDWKNWTTDGTIQGSAVSLLGYTATDLSVALTQRDGKISNFTLDAMVYDGKLHAVGSSDLSIERMPFDLALNVDGLDLHKLKTDIPTLKSEEINGKFYLTTIAKGALSDIKNLQAKGSFAIREGFLTEFAIFKGLLGVLNEALRLGQVMITNVECNFTVENQKMTTDSLRLISPTIVLLGQGWVNFDQMCDLMFAVDLTSGVVPEMAEQVLRTLSVRIYDKISNPKYDRKISVPQVLNTILKSIF